jgi:hypothetical protein
MTDETSMEDVTEIAVRAKLIGRCPICDQTWDLGTIDPDDEAELGETVAALREKDAEGVDAFEDAELVELLSRVIGEAAAEKGCSH